MQAKKRVPQLLLMILGGLMMTSLAACSLTKNNRTWIEQNRVSDIYKVYPTKDPEDLFKVFPDGFDIDQIYEVDGEMYKLELEGNPETEKISGQFLKSPYDKNHLSDVDLENRQIIFSNPTVKKDWPIDGFLFQQLKINQKYISNLEEKKHSYNGSTGDFSITYHLKDSTIDDLFDKQVTSFEIKGFGSNYYFRSLVFKFEDGSEFIEQISKPYN